MMQSTLLLSGNAFVPALAPLSILALLGAAFLLASAALGAGVAVAARRLPLAKKIGGAGLAVAVVYTTLLAAVSLLSRERTLAPGERKYFCEIDCHIAYEVTDAATPDATTRAVTVRTWFDPATIAPYRGDGPLRPNPRTVWLEDDAGRRYAPSAQAAQAWEAQHGASTPLDRDLRPGQSYTTTFAFTVPAGTRAARLFLGDAAGPEHFLIGHENSPFHRKAYFALPARQTRRVPNSRHPGGPLA